MRWYALFKNFTAQVLFYFNPPDWERRDGRELTCRIEKARKCLSFDKLLTIFNVNNENDGFVSLMIMCLNFVKKLQWDDGRVSRVLFYSFEFNNWTAPGHVKKWKLAFLTYFRTPVPVPLQAHNKRTHCTENNFFRISPIRKLWKRSTAKDKTSYICFRTFKEMCKIICTGTYKSAEFHWRSELFSRIFLFQTVLRIHDVWCGSGSGNPYLWLMDPDADPSIFIIDLQDANKKLICFNKFSCIIHFKGTFTSFSKVKK